MISKPSLFAKIRGHLPAILRRNSTIGTTSAHHTSPQDVEIPDWHESTLSRILSARLLEILGLILLALAVGIAASLFSFNPLDPSFNTATGTEPTNLLGRMGATIADGLIQLLGLTSILPSVVLLAWTWRLLRYHNLGLPILRLISAFVLFPCAAMLIGLLQLTIPGLDIPWPTTSGLGGESGVFLARKLMKLTTSEAGAMGGIVAIGITLVLLAILCPLSMGLQGHEWRSVGRGFAALFALPFRALRNRRPTGEMALAEENPTIYNPGPGSPVRYGRPAKGNGALPSGFLMRSLTQQASTSNPQGQAASAPPAEGTAQAWMSPPQATAPWQNSTPQNESTPVAEPLPQKHNEEDAPTNPYGQKLAHIYNNQPQVIPTEASHLEDSYEDDVEGDAPAPAQWDIAGNHRPALLKRFLSPSQRQQQSEPLPPSTSQAHSGAEYHPGSPHSVIQAEPISTGPVAHTTQQPSASTGSSSKGTAEPNGNLAEITSLSGWLPPSINLLNPPPASNDVGPSEETLQANAQMLEKVLSDYGVQGSITDWRAGPVVTLYELEPAPGVRSSRVIGLSDDLARSLAVLSVRIATVPGRNVIGIEVPNATRETVYFPDLLQSPAWRENKSKLPLALGKDIAGEPVFADLAKMPHLLVAGTTGSGKSVGINAMILSLLYRLSPEDCRLIMIDPKILELSIYDGIPHLMTPVVTEPPKAVSALKWAVQEMDRRYHLMADHQVRNISSYNDRIRRLKASGETPTRRIQTGYDPETGRPVFDEHRLPLEHLPYIVIVIDEMADLMMVAGKEIEGSVLRLAQKARAAGVHVIMATQRPSVDVITGTIKANFPTRISFQVTNKYDSRTILGEQGAEQLLGRGDMLFMQGGARITRVHGPFISDEEVEAVVADLRSKGEPVYNADVITEEPEEESAPANRSSRGSDSDSNNDMYEQAIELVIREQRASTSFVQRHLSIGYNRAANIIDQMEREGIISAANHVGKRDVLATRASLGLDQNDDEGDEE